MNIYTVCPTCKRREKVTREGVIRAHREPGYFSARPPCVAVTLSAKDFAKALSDAIAERRANIGLTARAIEKERAELEAKIAQWRAFDAEHAKEIAALEKLAAKLAKGGAK